MLDEFLTVAYERNGREKEKRAFIDNLKKLPRSELKALALGEKLAWAEPACSGPGSGVNSWIEQFKGTPLFDQAVALEQSELQLDAQDIQRRMQMPPPDDMWVQRDQVRLQKRLLELQLAQASGAPAGAPPDAARLAAAPQPASPPAPELAGSQGAGAVGAEELDNTEEVHNRPAGSLGLKMSSAEFASAKVRLKTAAAMRKVAGALPSDLARADGEKIALSPGAMGLLKGVASKLGPQGTKALIGAGVGAAGGALAGGPNHRLSGALGGAAVGGAGGMLYGNAKLLHGAGVPLGHSISKGMEMTGRQLQTAGQGLMGKLRGAKPGAATEAPLPKAPAA